MTERRTLEEEDEDVIAWTRRLSKPIKDQAKGPAKGEPVPKEAHPIDIPIGHENLDLSIGQSKILILEDQGLDDTADGVDTLVSLEQKEREKTDRQILARKMAKGYRPYDDEDKDKTFPNDKFEGEKKGESATDALPPATVHILKFQPAKRNVRRKLVSFDDAPIPIAQNIKPAVSGEQHALDTNDEKDEDFYRTLLRTRKKNIAAQNAPFTNIAYPDEAEMTITPQAEALVFTEATALAVTIDDATTSTSAEVVPSTSSTLPSRDLSMVPDRNYDGLLAHERQPNVRRFVASALKFLSQLGIRPQLSDELASPIQEGGLKPNMQDASKFAHIRIQHFDEEGNVLGPKEAYKELSHHFHGTKSGKGKREKLQRKRELAKKIQAASLTVEATTVLPVESANSSPSPAIIPPKEIEKTKTKKNIKILPKIFGMQ